MPIFNPKSDVLYIGICQATSKLLHPLIKAPVSFHASHTHTHTHSTLTLYSLTHTRTHTGQRGERLFNLPSGHPSRAGTRTGEMFSLVSVIFQQTQRQVHACRLRQCARMFGIFKLNLA